MKLSNNHLVGTRAKVIPSWLSYTLKKDYDRVVLIVGKEGVGKSTLAILLAHLVQKTKQKNNIGDTSEFDINENVYYDLKKLKKSVFKSSSSGDVRIIDEAAITGGYRREAMGKQNRLLNRTLMTCRSRNQILFFLIPSINSVESYILERCSTLIRVVNRGHAWIFHDKEIRRYIRWNPKSRRYQFKQRPFLHSEKYSSIDYHLGAEEWEKYKLHKEQSLSAEYEDDDEDEAEQINSGVYLGRKNILKQFDVSTTVWEQFLRDNPDKLRRTRGGNARVDPKIFEKWLFNEDGGENSG